MKFTGVFVCFWFISFITPAQNAHVVDSLQKILTSEASNKQKVVVYNLLAKAYRNSDTTLVTRYINQALQLARRTNDPTGVSDTWYTQAWIAAKRKDYPQALDFYELALQIAQKHNYKKGEANALKNLSVIHRKQDRYAKALNLMQQALEIFRELKDEAGMASSYNHLGIIYRKQGKYSKALAMYQVSLKLREKMGDDKSLGRVYNNLGIIYAKQGLYVQALSMHQASTKARERNGDQKGLGKSYNNLGITYRKIGSYSKALMMYQRLLKIKEGLGDRKGLAKVYNNIGAIYDDQHNYQQALKMYQRSLKIKKQIGDKRGVANSYYNLGRLYRLQGDDALSLKMLEESLKIRKQIGDKSGVATSYLGLGHWALSQNKAVKAVHYFKKSLVLLQEIGQKDRVAQNLVSLGTAHYLQKEYAKALIYLEEGVKKGQDIGNPQTIRDGAAYLAKTYRALGQLDQAYQQLELFKQMADSVLSEKNIRQITQLEERFVSQKRADCLLVLQNEKELALNAKIQTQKANQRTAIIGVILLGALLLVLGIFYRSKQRSNLRLNLVNQDLNLVNQELKNYIEELQIANENVQKANTKINDINQELQEQQDHIVGSINYAKRIQKAILPLDERIQEALPHHFILYRPLDIVSGDFYWFEELDDLQIIVVADCTGHGVPGAFMTMLGTQALNNIVVQNRVHSPDQILDHLDRILYRLLQSDTTQVEDGMDGGVCVINKTKQTLEYAGAKHPLILVQNGYLREIKGDRQGINTFRVDIPTHFTKHTIDISEPTTFFMYSDGYQDQFGGEQGRKFMKTAFLKLLEQIASKSPTEQKQILETTLDDWMNGNGMQTKQIDDILVMGVQLGEKVI